MEITETDSAYRAIYFKEAKDTSMKDEWAKGYVVQFGEINGEVVPKWIDYSKDKFTLDEAIKYAKNIKECAICNKINATVGEIERVVLKDQYKTQKPDEIGELRRELNELKTSLKPDKKRKNVVESVMSDITKDVINTIFTVPGRLDMYMATDDEAFIAGLIPENPTKEDILEIRAQVADFWSGDIGRVRNPAQMREYAKSQRDMIKVMRGEEIEDEASKKKRSGKPKVKIVA